MNKTNKTLLSFINKLTPSFYRPVFILSAPRSGSTHLYEIVRRMEKVFSLDRENDPMWHNFFPYQRLEIASDYINADECDSITIKAIKSYIVLKLIAKPSRCQSQLIFQNILFRKPIIYLEKTIANCFHIDVIEKIFPDALFIHLVRDGRACISSILEGWSGGLGQKQHGILTFPENSRINRWCYPIFPKWQEMTNKSVEQICAGIWLEHNYYVLEKYKNSYSFRQNYLKVRYEDLVEQPVYIAQKIADFANFKMTQDCLQYIQQGNCSRTTISKPKQDKWKEKNLNKINRILPMIIPIMTELGYTDC